MRDDQEFIERRIITGMIVSTDYLQRVQRIWSPAYMESPELKTVAHWCLDYFRQYEKAPDNDIQSIYMDELKKGSLSKAEAQYIEELLSDLSDEYGRGKQFNSGYLYDKTVQYFKAQDLERHQREVKALTDAGKVEEAEKLASSYRPAILEDEELGLDLSEGKKVWEAIDRAFSTTFNPVVTYPGALGRMWNRQLVRGAFFTLLAPEKRGKSMMLMEIAMRAIRQKANVAFFEAGDSTESQVLRRICIHVAQKSDMEEYCQERFRPVGDCILNQLDLCDREDRNCDHGIFDVTLETFLQQQHQFINLATLREKYEQHPDYEPCDSSACNERRGSVWLKRTPKCEPLTANEAKKKLRAFFRRYKRRFKLINYSAGTLTVSEMKRVLDAWERKDGFVPDVIVVDYADLLSADDGKISEFRHRQDHIWKSLRALSQERHALVVSATQADAESYKKGRLTMSNFSEDKRKLAHVTAQYGLNQDPQGREKSLGIMRINEIVVREGAFSNDREVYVLQDIAAGRAYLESFFQ